MSFPRRRSRNGAGRSRRASAAMRQSARDLARVILEDKTVQEQLLQRARRGELPASVLTRFLPYWSGPPPTTPQEREPAERENQSLSKVIRVLTSEEQKQFGSTGFRVGRDRVLHSESRWRS